MRLGPEDISRRIREAGDEYVDGSITADELEEEIERAFRLEYSYEELLMSSDFTFLHSSDGGRVLGREVAPGESIRLDDMYDVEPLELDICPYDRNL